MEGDDRGTDVWGAKASDWVTHQEPQLLPLYEQAFQRAGVGPGLRHLDAGCGAGLAIVVSHNRGAEVSGFDPSPTLLAVARRRVPAADLRVGKIEAPPHPPGRFDVITMFNVAHDAEDEALLAPLRGQGRPRARLVASSWGRPEDCDMAELFAAIGTWSPANPHAGPFGLGLPGRFEALLGAAGFSEAHGEEVTCPFRYANLEQALLGLLSAAPFVAATRQVGDDAVREMLTEIMLRYRRPDGVVVLENTFRLVFATV